MRFARLILFVFLTMLAAGARAQTDAQPVDVEVMHRCQTFSDCTLVYGCSDDAINKLYEKQYKRPSVCAETKSHDPKALPTCEEGKCVAVSITKGNGQ